MMTLEIPQPPMPPSKVATAYSDHIRDLGDRIAALTVVEAIELYEFLRDKV
jgi:hypothetical protein